MKSINIFIIRIIIGSIIAVILSRFFYPDADIQGIAALGAMLVGLAYVTEFWRNRKSR